LSVRSATQVSHISSSSSCAGVAAAAGELVEDQKHRDSVEETGCDFIPLVVETFGVWSPFALKFLYIIADRTTARSGDWLESTCCSNCQYHFGPATPR